MIAEPSPYSISLRLSYPAPACLKTLDANKKEISIVRVFDWLESGD
jgi:hypothetical protein